MQLWIFGITLSLDKHANIKLLVHRNEFRILVQEIWIEVLLQTPLQWFEKTLYCRCFPLLNTPSPVLHTQPSATWSAWTIQTGWCELFWMGRWKLSKVLWKLDWGPQLILSSPCSLAPLLLISVPNIYHQGIRAPYQVKT